MANGKKVYDISLDEDFDLMFSGGDFATDEATAQNQTGLILDDKGEWKENPDACVGATDYLDDEGPADLLRAITKEFTRDGMDVKKVELGANGVINTDAEYK